MNDKLLYLAQWLYLALPAILLLLAGVWYFRPGVQRRLLPPQEEVPVPWTGLEVLAVLLLTIALIPALVQDVLASTGVLHWVSSWRPKENLAGLVLGGWPEASFPGNVPWGPLVLCSEHGEVERARWDLWRSTFNFPLDLIAIPLLLHLMSRTQLRELGLGGRYFFRNLFAGFLGWLAITPFVYAIEMLIQPWIQGPPESHSLAKVAQYHPRTIDLILIPFVAVIAAPLAEELLFRGVLLRWLARRSEGGAVIMAASLVWVVLLRGERITTGWKAQGAEGALTAGAPVLFAFLLVPGFVFLRLRWRSPAAEAIYGTSVLFAVGHATWPHPIPLFVLGLALGYLAHRTQSLVGPMLLHALFNGVACVMLLMSK